MKCEHFRYFCDVRKSDLYTVVLQNVIYEQIKLTRTLKVKISKTKLRATANLSNSFWILNKYEKLILVKLSTKVDTLLFHKYIQEITFFSPNSQLQDVHLTHSLQLYV